MKIASIVKTSFVDFAPHIACVIFTKGCNMTCEYCHNIELNYLEELLEEDEVLDFLKGRTHLLDAVVISGGEPTLHKDLPEFIRKCKELGYLIKLDTNGTNPVMLKELIDQSLVDYIAMDIKATEEKYTDISGISYQKIQKSKKLLIYFGQYEFRTTLYPKLTKEDIYILCNEYEKYNYVVQQYRPTEHSKMKPYEDEFLVELGNKFKIKIR